MKQESSASSLQNQVAGPEANTCPACGALPNLVLDDVKDALTGEAFRIRKCAVCRFGITEPHPSDIGPYYAHYYGSRHGVTALPRARRRLNHLQRLRLQKGSRLLDVGCGDGLLLTVARDAGFNVAGVERNPEPAAKANLQIYPTMEAAAVEGPYDCITFWHSLEHMPDPVAMIHEAKAMLRPGGILIISVPDSEGSQARYFGRHWFHLDVPRHLFHFTKPSLSTMLERAGYRMLTMTHQELEYDLVGWSQSAMNAMGLKQNALHELMTGRLADRSLAYRFAIFLLGGALTVFSIPLVLVSTALGRGGTLVVTAQKP